MPATRELGAFGWIWAALGCLLLVAAVGTDATRELDGAELTLVLVLVGLSIGSVLGGLLLARRTGPEILYYRILDHGPPPPRGVPRETAGGTARRVAAPAIGVTLGLILLGAIAAATMLLLGGQPRDEVREDLAAATLIVAGAWTLACGMAGLATARYFSRWQTLRGGLVLCRPLKAGTMRPVYWVERRGP